MPQELTSSTSANERFRWLIVASWTVPSVGFLAIVLFSLHFSSAEMLSILSSSLLTALAALIAGVFLGFLFGIPHALQDPNSTTSRGSRSAGEYAVNTNLEQISDWLTKILVGVGLVQLGNIGEGLGRLVGALESAFGGAPPSKLFAAALLSFYTTWGFLVGYLLTRTYLTAALKSFDVSDVVLQTAQVVTEQVEVRAEEQGKADVTALGLVYHQLNMNSNDEPVEQSKLTEALQGASAAIREQITLQIQAQRRSNWDWEAEDRPDHKAEKIKRLNNTIPAIRALTETRPEDAQCHAELGYALKDKKHPNLPLAYAELTRALALDTYINEASDWYSVNRAIVGIRRLKESTFNGDPAKMKETILNDLQVAYSGRPRVRALIREDTEIRTWLEENSLSLAHKDGKH